MTVCAYHGCGTILRRGNPGPMCAPHELLLDEEARRKGTLIDTPPPTVIEQILAILARGPSTVTQMAFESGRLKDSIRRELLELIGQRLVEQGPKVDGDHGYRLRETLTDLEARVKDAPA